MSAKWTQGTLLLLVILVVVDIAKHVATFAIGPAPVCMDVIQYLGFGRSVARGDFFLFEHAINYRMPGYSWALGLCVFLFDRYAMLAAIVAQHGLAMATSFIPPIICYRITNRPSAFVSAYALSVVGVSRVWFANVLLAATLFTFCVALVWWAWYEYLRRPNAWTAVRLGFALSLAVIVRPDPQLLIVPILFTIVFHAYYQPGRQRWSRASCHGLIVTGILIASVSPWLYRNWAMFGEPFLAKLPTANKWQVCFQEGASAHLPLPLDESGMKLVGLLQRCRHDPEELYCYSVIGSLEQSGMSERDIDDLLSQVCISAIVKNPLQFGFAAIKRSVNLWRCLRDEYPPFGAGEISEHGDQFVWRNQAVADHYEPILRNALSRNLRMNEFILLMVVVGSWWLVRDPRTRSFGVALVLGFAYFTAVTAAVEIENYRYRMTLEPAMIVAVIGGFFTRFCKLPPSVISSAQTPAK